MFGALCLTALLATGSTDSRAEHVTSKTDNDNQSTIVVLVAMVSTALIMSAVGAEIVIHVPALHDQYTRVFNQN